ncbi:MAG: DUF1801 domain-containing protein [Gemmatimonas sp.]
MTAKKVAKTAAKKGVAKQSAATTVKKTAKVAASGSGSGTGSAAVDAFLSTLDHPLKDAVVLLRDVILSADKSIADDIKWNTPSYRTTEFFATTNLRQKGGVAIVLHFGAKKRDIKPRSAIADRTGLLKWLADDRAIVLFADADDVQGKRTAFAGLIREWIAHV